MSRKRTNFSESLRENSQTYRFYLDRLVELSVSMFKWEGLPESIDARFLEMTLFNQGAAVFFEDEVLGPLALPFAASGAFDIYGIPTKRRAYAVNGYHKSLNTSDSVIIYNNNLHTNSVSGCTMYSKRLYNLDRIVDVNANAQKTPILLQCPENQRLTILNLFKEYDGNSPVIHGDKNLDINAIKAISTGAPYVADKIYLLKTSYWEEALTYLGIPSMEQKKERMIVSEATQLQGGVTASRYSRLQARQDAAEKINKMFGLEIEVDYRADLMNPEMPGMPLYEGEVTENG